MGTTVRALLDLAGGVPDGAALAAVQPGGASSNFLGPDQLDVPAGLRLAGRGRLDARLRRAGGDGRGHRPARGRDQHAAVLPRRVVRQVRALPGRLDQGARPAHRARWPAAGWTTGRGRVLELERTLRTTSICGLGQVALARWPACSACSAAARRAPAAAGLTSPDAATGGGASSSPTRPSARPGPASPPARRTAVETGRRWREALAPGAGRAGHRAARPARLRPVHRRRLRGAGGRHLRRVRGAARPTSTWPGSVRDGRRARGRGRAGRRGRDADRWRAARPAPTPW